MTEPDAIEILRRNAARIRLDIKLAWTWSWLLTTMTVVVMFVNMAAICWTTYKYEPPGVLLIGLCGMTLIFIDGMHHKVKTQRVRIEMLQTALEQLEVAVRAQGETP